MPRRTYKIACQANIAAACALLAAACAEPNTTNSSTAVAEIHRDVLTLDAHADIRLPSTPDIYVAPDGDSSVSLAKLTEGQMDAIVLAARTEIFPNFEVQWPEAREVMDLRFAAIDQFIDDSNGKVVNVRSPDELTSAVAQDKIAVIIAVQNFLAFNGDVGLVDHYFEKGARVFSLAFLGNNEFVDSSRPLPWQEVEPLGGLSEIGRLAVCRINALGGVVDVSQMTDKGALQTMSLSTAPVVASHSAVRALEANPRNVSDEILDAIAENNGLVNITVFRWYLKGVDPAEYVTKVSEIRREIGVNPEFGNNPFDGLNDAQRLQFMEGTYSEWTEGSVTDLVDHIDYVVERIGVDHIGIGSDFNHGAGVEGYRHAGQAQNVTGELLRRGYSKEDIAKIWGGNFLRVFADVQSVARSEKSTSNCQ